MRWQKYIREVEVIILQNKITERRTLVQVKAVCKWISDLKIKAYMAEMLSSKLTILRRDYLDST